MILYRVYQRTTFTVETAEGRVLAECRDVGTADRICELLNDNRSKELPTPVLDITEVLGLLARGMLMQDLLLPRIRSMQGATEVEALTEKVSPEAELEVRAAKRRTDRVFF